MKKLVALLLLAFAPAFGHVTLYVSPSGSDSNDGLTPQTSLASIQRAADLASGYEIDSEGLTIRVADGTYTQGVVLRPLRGVGALTGNTASPSSVTLSVTNSGATHLNYGSSPIHVASHASWKLSGLKLETFGFQASCVFVDHFAVCEFGLMEFGACSRFHLENRHIGFLTCVDSYTISGGAGRHLVTHNNSTSLWAGKPNGTATPSAITVTLVGTPNFSFAFLDTYRSGAILCNASFVTFSGAATGRRYASDLNGVIDTQGGGTSYFPGNQAGVAQNGGIYNP